MDLLYIRIFVRRRYVNIHVIVYDLKEWPFWLWELTLLWKITLNRHWHLMAV